MAKQQEDGRGQECCSCHKVSPRRITPPGIGFDDVAGADEVDAYVGEGGRQQQATD